MSKSKARSVKGEGLLWCLVFLLTAGALLSQVQQYPWLQNYAATESIENRIPPPQGYQRLSVSTGSFAQWLRGLPLKPGTPDVLLFDGRKKANQAAHAAVLDIDVGTKDLQQCADAVIRLRADYLFARAQYDKIRFRLTSGDIAEFGKWLDGFEPTLQSNRLVWVSAKDVDTSYAGLRKYLEFVFAYAGSYSLSQEMRPVLNTADMKPGDVFIKGGFPGHAVIVLDMAVREDTGGKVFLLGQSYWPAQDIHILKNPGDSALSPWYALDFESLVTPEWTFGRLDLCRFID